MGRYILGSLPRRRQEPSRQDLNEDEERLTAVIAIDWDGTIVDSSTKVKDPELLPEAKKAIARFREEGHQVVIFSANNPKWIQKWLDEWGIVVDYIWDDKGKLNADIFVDDKGYHKPFNDSWSGHIDNILNDPRVKGRDNRRW